MYQAALFYANLKIEQVDTVLITHAHPDHIAGTLTVEIEALVVTYPVT